MQVDPEYLRQHYGSLSDDALLAVNRSDLVEAAQKCYDAELNRRELNPRGRIQRSSGPPAAPRKPDLRPEPADPDEPEWLHEATEVYSSVVLPGQAPAPDAENARAALEAAGIPCYLELSEISQEKSSAPRPTHQWRLLVPGQRNLQATSILERDIFNQDFEEEWKAHLAVVSDEELRAMHPESAFCGLFDRIERVVKAYEEELAHRNLK